MKWRCVALVFVTFLFTVNYVEGEAITHIDCLDIGVGGHRAELRCSIEGTVTTGITWVRPDGELMVECDEKNTECSSFTLQEGYFGYILSPTLNSLIIESYTPEFDAGRWMCSDGPLGRKSSCNKTTGKYTEANTSIDCLNPGIEGQRTELKCPIIGTIGPGIRWSDPSGTDVVVCNSMNTICLSNYPDYVGETSHTANTLVIKSFRPRSDLGQWSCKDGLTGTQSTCTKGKADMRAQAASVASIHDAPVYLLAVWTTAMMGGIGLR